MRGQTYHKGTNRAQTQIFADSRRFSLFPRNKAFGKRRFSQKTADFRRNPQKTAGTRRKPQIGVCPLRFVPLSAALQSLLYFLRFSLFFFSDFPSSAFFSQDFRGKENTCFCFGGSSFSSKKNKGGRVKKCSEIFPEFLEPLFCLGTHKHLPPKIFRGKLWLHPALR